MFWAFKEAEAVQLERRGGGSQKEKKLGKISGTRRKKNFPEPRGGEKRRG